MKDENKTVNIANKLMYWKIFTKCFVPFATAATVATTTNYYHHNNDNSQHSNYDIVALILDFWRNELIASLLRYKFYIFSDFMITNITGSIQSWKTNLWRMAHFPRNVHIPLCTDIYILRDNWYTTQWCCNYEGIHFCIHLCLKRCKESLTWKMWK